MNTNDPSTPWTIRRLEDELRRRNEGPLPADLERRLIAAIPRSPNRKPSPRAPLQKPGVLIAAVCALGLLAMVIRSAALPWQQDSKQTSLHTVLNETRPKSVPLLEQRASNPLQETDPCHILPPLSFSL